MGWLFLFTAIVLEVAGTVFAKQAHGFTNLAASTLMITFYTLSVVGLTLAMRTVEMSVAYPTWQGISILVTSIIGIAVFRESMNLAKGFSIFCLALAVVGLIMSEP